MAKKDQLFIFKALDTPLLKLSEKLDERNIPYDYNKMVDIIRKHSIGAGLSSIAGAWVPGAALPTFIAANIGFVWSMYYRLAKHIGMDVSKNKMKLFGKAILSNLAMNAGSILPLLFAEGLSFIPVIGGAVSGFVDGAIATTMVAYAAVLFLNLVSKSMDRGVNIENLSESELNRMAREAYTENKSDIDAGMKKGVKEVGKALKNNELTLDKDFEIEKDDEEM